MQEKAAIIIYVILAICGASVGTASSHAEWSSLGYSHSSHFSSSSDSGPSCLDICGNSSTQLVWSVPYVINYALPDGSEWFEEEICNCSWLIAAPDDSVIEVSVIRNRPPNGPQISVYSDDEGAKSSLMYELQHGELGIYYSNVSTIHIAATHPTDFSFQFKPVVCDIKLTAYEKQECSPDQFKCYNQQCLVGDRQCDGKTDCQVHEDEYGCGINCSSVDQYVCPASSTCIGSHLVCDGHGDCPGIFDELNCGRCGDPHIDLGFNPTVSITQPVDFAVGCLWLVTASSHSHSRFRVDIINLPVVVHGSTTTQPASLSLGHGRDPANGHKLVRTMNSTTYPAVVTLDSPVMWIILDTHCDASELPAKWLDCLEFTLSEYDIKECPSNQYACSAGLLCIDRTRLCDGVADCPEFDDEFGCGSCSTNMFTCRNLGGCVDASMLCDGQHDCTDGSDEGKCEPCGTDVIHLSSGPYILSSIGYPANYPHNAHCLWHVYAENDYDVLVVFHDFKTEN
ncbi:sortilin-related receptor-like, partial [Acanthaster planci]|uniref:Sortilin-related receptor-like n=1 Tax=Acanthaster planci TaxID=133434 RepID=A0A8B7ZVN5_ACAPL